MGQSAPSRIAIGVIAVLHLLTFYACLILPLMVLTIGVLLIFAVFSGIEIASILALA